MAGMLQAFAGAIHLAVAPAHGESTVTAGFFVAAGVLQLGLSVPLARRPSARVATVAAGANVVLIAIWVLAHTIGLPTTPHPWDPEPVAPADLAATFAEVATVGLVWRRPVPDASAAHSRRRPFTLVATAVLGAAGIGSGWLPTHDHGAVRHVADSAGGAHGGHGDVERLLTEIRAGALSYEAALRSLGAGDLRTGAQGSPDDAAHEEQWPRDITVTPEGVWLTVGSDGVVHRLDPDGGAVDLTASVGSTPVAIVAAGPWIWVTDFGSGTVVRIDRDDGQPVGPPTPVGRRPVGITAGAGAVWVVNSTEGTLSRLDPVTGAVSAVSARLGWGLTDVVVAGGAVWVTATLDRAVVRVDPRSLEPVGPPVGVPPGPVALAAAGGRVWVASSTAGTITPIDARSGRLDGEPVVVDTGAQPGRGPVDLVVRGDRVWVVNNRTRSVMAVDAVTGSLSTTQPLGGDPARSGVTRIAVGAGWVWVSDSDSTEIVRIGPVE